MSSSMWYIMQSIQSKYSLSERLIRTIAAIRSFPHDNVEDLIRGSMVAIESLLFQPSCLMIRPLLL
uniref:Ankyrin repeat and SOCS box containing 8 n=1 Tax=Balaenoptera musculus TaxID=9771 RepID=A0A8C0DHT6_BALMU